MKHRCLRARWPVLPLLGWLLLPTLLQAAPGGHHPCAVIDINRIGPNALTTIKAAPGVEWWLELGSELLVCGEEQPVAALTSRYRALRFYRQLPPERLRLSEGLSPAELAELGAEVVARGGRLMLVNLPQAAQHRWRSAAHSPTARLGPVTPNTVLVRQLANDPALPAAPAKATVLDLVDEVDSDRWLADITTLAGWDRATLRTEIYQARDWLVQQLQAMPGLTVTTPTFTVSHQAAFNVVATLTGHSRPDDWYIVGGHYDSVNNDPPYEPAPGAEDNASGCAGVLELARIFTAHAPAATMIFICYSGEEQGLYGSDDHADDLYLAGDASKVKAMLDMDMIGYTADSELDCLLESAAFAEPLVNTFAAAAALYASELVVSISWSPWGSDHVPYLNLGMPALLTIDDFFEYPYYHSAEDTADKIVPAMGLQILRMNVAAMAELAGAGDPVLFADGFESGDLTRWSATTP